MGSGNAGTISAVNATGFTAPPSSTNIWTANSYVACNNIGPGRSGITVTVAGNTLVGTLLAFYQPDKTNVLYQVPNGAIYCNESQVFGAIQSATSASYNFNVPGGTVYIGCSAFTSGSVEVAIESGTQFLISGGNGDLVTIVGPLDGSGNVKVSTQANALGTERTGQIVIATTGTAVNFPSLVCVNGCVVSAGVNNASITSTSGSVGGSVGGSSVTDATDGTGNGWAMIPGSSIGFAVGNANQLWCNGKIGDVFYVSCS